MMAAEDNIQVVSPTTPAQYFHLLRRQALRKWRKPLVVMSPKSLLRHPKVVSRLDEFERGQFQRVLPDTRPNPARTERVLLCSGKIYYELEKHREEMKRDDVAIIRVEQLYPFPLALLEQAIGHLEPGQPVYWIQEEAENMGAWRYLRVTLGESVAGRWPFRGVSRPASASPATGSANSHKQEQEQIISAAFGEEPKTHKRAPLATAQKAARKPVAQAPAAQDGLSPSSPAPVADETETRQPAPASEPVGPAH
jgi:2-oxoglutarate dehydrogenase E1 component